MTNPGVQFSCLRRHTCRSPIVRLMPIFCARCRVPGPCSCHVSKESKKKERTRKWTRIGANTQTLASVLSSMRDVNQHTADKTSNTSRRQRNVFIHKRLATQRSAHLLKQVSSGMFVGGSTSTGNFHVPISGLRRLSDA